MLAWERPCLGLICGCVVCTFRQKGEKTKTIYCWNGTWTWSRVHAFWDICNIGSYKGLRHKHACRKECMESIRQADRHGESARHAANITGVEACSQSNKRASGRANNMLTIMWACWCVNRRTCLLVSLPASVHVRRLATDRQAVRFIGWQQADRKECSKNERQTGRQRLSLYGWWYVCVHVQFTCKALSIILIARRLLQTLCLPYYRCSSYPLSNNVSWAQIACRRLQRTAVLLVQTTR